MKEILNFNFSQPFYTPQNLQENISRDELINFQTQHLKKVLKKVYQRVPYYREKFDQNGVHPDDFKELVDLNKFPFTTKEDLRKNYPFKLFAEPMDKVIRVHASSGTTGKPTVVGYTKNDIDNWSELMARSIYTAGGRAGNKILVSYGYGLFTGGLGAHYGGERLGALVIPMSGGNTEKQIQLIHDFQPDIIMVTPSYLLNIVEVMKNKNLDLKKINLKIGILGAEPWSEEMRNKIENELPIDAIDIYGLSEIIGPGVANEAIDEKGKLYLWEDHFFPEIIDSERKQVLNQGEKGELILTSLTKEAMPLIRYRTRDITRLSAGGKKPFRMIDKILGRNDDMLIIRGVNVFPSQIEEVLLQFNEVSPVYQLEVNQANPLWQLIVNIELISSKNTQAQEKLSIKIAKKIKNIIGVSVIVKIHPVYTIERSVGKAKRVILV